MLLQSCYLALLWVMSATETAGKDALPPYCSTSKAPATAFPWQPLPNKLLAHFTRLQANKSTEAVHRLVQWDRQTKLAAVLDGVGPLAGHGSGDTPPQYWLYEEATNILCSQNNWPKGACQCRSSLKSPPKLALAYMQLFDKFLKADSASTNFTLVDLLLIGLADENQRPFVAGKTPHLVNFNASFGSQGTAQLWRLCLPKDGKLVVDAQIWLRHGDNSPLQVDIATAYQDGWSAAEYAATFNRYTFLSALEWSTSAAKELASYWLGPSAIDVTDLSTSLLLTPSFGHVRRSSIRPETTSTSEQFQRDFRGCAVEWKHFVI